MAGMQLLSTLTQPPAQQMHAVTGGAGHNPVDRNGAREMSEAKPLTLDDLQAALRGYAAAFRRVTEYQPAGGPGDKIFPPTYEGGRYATEERLLDDRRVPCVLLDSVQSQANRMESGLLEAHRRQQISLPLVSVRFDQDQLLKKFTVTSLDAPHRVADAILRDSMLDGVMFRHSSIGRTLDTADVRNATGLFGLNPTALVFGLWDSTGPRGGLGAKFQRALVSEMIGYDAVPGSKTSSRIDPAQIMRDAGTLYHRKTHDDAKTTWTLDEAEGQKKLGKDGKPSEVNHGNVTPGLTVGGFTISKAKQTTVLSLTALRRLRFPLDGTGQSDPAVDVIAQSVLAALGLGAAAIAHAEMTDLRSRCQLFPTAQEPWELLNEPGKPPQTYVLGIAEAVALINQAARMATDVGLPWNDELSLTPAPELIELVRRSQELAIAFRERDA